jgi:hypothetical protein
LAATSFSTISHRAISMPLKMPSSEVSGRWECPRDRTDRGGEPTMYRPFYLPECSALCFSADSIPSETTLSRGCNVFVCGALQDPARISALLGTEPPFAPAVATGYRRTVERVAGGEVPFMVPDEDDARSVLTGVVWLDLSGESLEKIESLELDRGFRKRITIEARIGERKVTAFTYVKR